MVNLAKGEKRCFCHRDQLPAMLEAGWKLVKADGQVAEDSSAKTESATKKAPANKGSK